MGIGVCCLAAAIGISNREKRIADAYWLPEITSVRETYGKGYTLRLTPEKSTVEGIPVIASVLLKKDGAELAAAEGESTTEYVLTQTGEYQLVYYAYVNDVYYNRIYRFSVEEIPYFDFSSIETEYALGDEILLSVNEGQLPKAGSDASFIPYNLRKAFGMTTIDHKIAVYAYYFYRLLQRAEHVTLLYNTSSEGLNRGEMSRFMLQFLIEWEHEIQLKNLKAAQSPQDSEPICITKTPEIMKRMQDIFDVRVNEKALLSPSALNCYLDCPLRFYYQYVARLSAPDEVNTEIDSAKFGSIFHYAAEHIYKDLTEANDTITGNDLETLLKDKNRLHQYVDNGFRELFFQIPQNERPEYNGLQLLNSEVIYRYLVQLLRIDKKHTPFHFVASEKHVDEEISVHTPKGTIKTRIGGIIDRLDQKDNTLRIVDYKTGGQASSPTNVASLFIPDKKRSNYVFQTFLYAAIVCNKLRLAERDTKVAPALLYIHQAAAEDYSPVITMGEPRKKKEPVEDFSLYEDEFRTELNRLLEEIFNPDGKFEQTEIEEKCAYCDFKGLCKK